MRSARLLFVAVMIVAGCVGAEAAAPEAALSVTAHQDFGLSLKHAWTVEVKGGELGVVRPGKQRRSHRLTRVEAEHLRSVLRDTKFQVLPARLGQAGACDDCPRCVVDVDAGDGAHRVERVAAATTELAPTESPEDARFRVMWTAVKRLAGLNGVPDACW